MAWTLTIGFLTGADLVFAVTDTTRALPIVDPQYRFEPSGAEPSTPARVFERWEIKDAYYVVASTVGAMVDLFNSEVVAALQDPADPVNEVILKLDGTEKWAMRSSTYRMFRVTELKPGPWEQAAGTAFIKFSMVLEGIKELSASTAVLTRGFGSARGFETRKLTAKVTTQVGTSARTAAITAALLSLPSSAWRYITSRGDRVDVEHNQADTEATGTCTIQEQAIALASGTNEYERERVEETTSDGTRVTLTITAQGSGAENAVRAGEPSGAIAKTVRINEALNTASAVYITEEPASGDGKVTRRERVYSVRGGGRPRTETPISGRDEQWVTVGARRALYLQEQYTVRARGPEALADILTGRLAFPERFDLERSHETMPRRVGSAASAAGEEWERSCTRVYVFADGKAPSAAALFKASLDTAAFRDKTQVKPDYEEGR